MTEQDVSAVAKTIRSLAIDAVERAQSGHPGLPLGLAEVGALLYGEFLRHDPATPQWVNRDRFVLSAGHGSMLQYALLHLAGFGLSIDEITRFRQLHSLTPGHPEYGVTRGVEATTGPLGQGMGNAVGFAIGEAHLCPQFTDSEGSLIDHNTYCIASDGDLMEGVSAEAASLAGHLRLGKLIVFYDDNQITIEGQTDLTISENIEQRFAAYGWQTLSASAYDSAQLRKAVEMAHADVDRPTLIRVQSIIGKGSPNKAGTADVHGAPLGKSEAAKTRAALAIEGEFYVDPRARDYFRTLQKEQAAAYEAWCVRFDAWKERNAAQYIRWQGYFQHLQHDYAAVDIPGFDPEGSIATRSASGTVLQRLVMQLPHLIGGSADLGPSNKTVLTDIGHFSAQDRSGRLLHFGLREHAMGAITNGLSLYGAFRPFCATFLVFSDYMRASIRMAALMGQPVIYIFSHDSIYVGEDGPTHQPIEHLAALRAIPNLCLYRPADAEETAAAWRRALQRRDGPTVLIISRQSLPVLDKSDPEWQAHLQYGAYCVHRERGSLQTVIVATGSEVSLAVAAAKQIGTGVRVLSVCCREHFNTAPQSYRTQLLPTGVRRVVIEAGVSQGWEGYVERNSDMITMSKFGASGPAAKVAAHYGFTADNVIAVLTGKEQPAQHEKGGS